MTGSFSFLLNYFSILHLGVAEVVSWKVSTKSFFGAICTLEGWVFNVHTWEKGELNVELPKATLRMTFS